VVLAELLSAQASSSAANAAAAKGSAGQRAADAETTTEGFNQELHALAERSDDRGALAVFNRMRAAGAQPNLATFNHIFRACKKARSVETRMLEALYAAMQTARIEPDTTTYHELLSCYGRTGAVQEAENLFHQMKASGVQLDVRMYSSLLTGYGRAADKDKLETKESFSKVDAVFNDMRAAGVKPDVAVYNAYIMAACRCEKWLAAVQIFEDLEATPGLQPEMLSYNQTILAYGRLGQWENALGVFNTMKESEHTQPDEMTYNYLIGQCGRRREWQVAAGLFGQMQRRGVQPTVVTYNQLITSYADSGQLHRCLPVLRRMMDLKRCKPNMVTFNALLMAFSQDTYDLQASRDPQVTLMELVELWERLLEARCRPTCLTYDAFVGACESMSLKTWDSVLEELEAMLADEKRWDSRQREIVCNLLLCVYERARMCSHAHALYDRMKAQGYAPVLVTYNALLGLCEYERKWKTALSIFETMRARNVNPDAVTYNALISTLEECGEWEQATAWLETALERGMIHCFTSEDTTCELDLHHTRSAGTAQAILRYYLRNLRTIALVDKRKLPTELKVITGWGRHSVVMGYSPVKERTLSLLKALNSPFQVPDDNPGMLIATGDLVHKWLVKEEIVSLLRFVSGNGASWRRNFSPSDPIETPPPPQNASTQQES